MDPKTALVVVDVLNAYEHEDADRLAESMAGVVPHIAGLVERARGRASGDLRQRQRILSSALDAYLRHLRVAVPVDGVAHIDRELADAALRMMRRNMRADVQPSADCAF